MSSTGAGFGFVGSTFGEVDVVSPYVQRAAQEGEQAEMPRVEEGDIPDVSAVDGVHQKALDAGLSDFHKWSTSPEIFAQTLALSGGATNPEEYKLLTKVNNERTSKTRALERLAANLENSNKLYTELAPQIKDSQSNYFIHQNKEVLRKYADGWDFLNEMLEDEKMIVTSFGSNNYYAIKADEDARGELESLGVEITKEEDGILYVESDSRAFSLSEDDFISGDNPAKVAESVKVPFVDKKEGSKSADGSYYRSGNKYVDMPKLRSVMAYNVFVNTDKFNNDDVKSLELTSTGKIQATKLEIEPDGNGFYSREDAERVLEEMVKYSSDQNGFKKETSEGEAPEKDRASKTDSLNATPKLSDGGEEGAIPFTGAGDDDVFKGVGFKAENAISIKATKARIFIPGFSGSNLIVTDIATDGNKIFIKGSTRSEAVGIFGADKEYAAGLYEAGITKSQTSSETKWIPLEVEALSQLQTQLGIESDSPNAREAMLDYLRTSDTSRTKDTSEDKSDEGAEGAKPSKPKDNRGIIDNI